MDKKTNNNNHPIQGNYQTFISIQVPFSLKYENIINEIKKKISCSNPNIKLSPIDKTSLHISLLKANKYIKHLEIQPLLSELRSSIPLSTKQFSIAISNRIKFLSNSISNKHFISLLAIKNKSLNKLYKEIEHALSKFNLDEDSDSICSDIKSSFICHISLLSSEDNDYCISEEELTKEISNGSVKVIKLIEVKCVNVAIGSKMYEIPLKE